MHDDAARKQYDNGPSSSAPHAVSSGYQPGSKVNDEAKQLSTMNAEEPVDPQIRRTRVAPSVESQRVKRRRRRSLVAGRTPSTGCQKYKDSRKGNS
ncbi:hypothetical protein MGYG_08326 [Nannizzia gypsea CBS 118893]|uniref:Uncharacterized protein n=1 Tax=Arthroderma gypseum (strain ATCC MYA-4604 / CBS 118893) TaxID=535722 RepID=E4V6D2_ARTGP|nr:hypothetical protein MGYG_08326 [Nannizzia gypsea CBS 118893]EFR05315.1 hypothetical protein MGYG_08326 [Nannizzia gypsea CBS 118893]